MEQFIPLSVPNLNGNELEYVKHAIQTEWVSTAGAYITEFENKIAQYVKSSNAVACQSGTAGLHLALQVCGIGYDDEVIVPTLTFIAAINPIKYLGAEPVFMDCDDSLTIDVNKVEEFCENKCDFNGKNLLNKKTGKIVKAILVVHVFGNIADLKKISNIAKKYNIKLIEDATEALGTYYVDGIYRDRFAGTIGDIGVFSFNGNKIITTGGGGMIVTDNYEMAERCRYLSTQAKNDDLYFVHDEIGYNYRMTNLQAALGLAQLEQLEGFIEIKKRNYNEYKKLGINLLNFKEEIRPNYWFYSFLNNNRDDLLQYLSKQGIQTRPIWKLIHTLKPYAMSQVYNIEKAKYYYDHILNLPCSSNLSLADIKKVVTTIKQFE